MKTERQVRCQSCGSKDVVASSGHNGHAVCVSCSQPIEETREEPSPPVVFNLSLLNMVMLLIGVVMLVMGLQMLAGSRQPAQGVVREPPRSIEEGLLEDTNPPNTF